jgi:hypothetical protein
MDRRKFIGRLFATPLLAGAASLVAKAAQFPSSAPAGQSQFPGSPQSQQGPMQPNGVSPPWFQLPPMPRVDPKLVLKEDQKEIVRDAKRLLDLASKLEHQVEKTDSTKILSLNMIHTTSEIEKLAKHIRSLASG